MTRVSSRARRRLFPLLLLGACGAPAGLADGLRIELASASVARGPDGTAVVDYRVVNGGGRAVYLERCGDRLVAAVDRWDGVRWHQYSGDGCRAVEDMSPLLLEAGARRASARAIVEPGRYRLRVGTRRAPSADADWSTSSAAFEVR